MQDRPDLAPEGLWESDYRIVAHPSFTEGITAVSTFIFAYAGTPFYFPIVAEMRDHRHFTKALLLCQAAITLVYLVIGIVVYYYCGSYVASPALGSAGSLIKKISYGIALPGLLASSTLSTHVCGILMLPGPYAYKYLAVEQTHLRPHFARIQAPKC